MRKGAVIAMKFGVFSVSMPEYTVEEAPRSAKELGYDFIEWRVGSMPKEEPKDYPYERRYWAWNKSTLDENNIMADCLRAKKACDEAGIEIVGISPSLPLEADEKFEAVCRAAQAIGCHQVRYGLIGFDPIKSGLTYPEQFKRMRQKLEALEPMLKETDVKLVIEMHHGTLTASASSAYRMLEGLDPKRFGLIYDAGNMVFEGYEDYLKSLQLLGDYIAHYHLKNGILEYDGVDELGAAKWKQTSVPLKKGQANLNKLFEAKKQVGYDGTVSIEDFSNESPTYEKLVDNLKYMHELYDATYGKE